MLLQRMTRRLFAPEVIQSSGMDCGPASLKCLLDGHYIPVSYGRLREACQTDVDGTSIDTLEQVAVQLGLQAEQIMVPTDHILLAEAQALPAIVVVRLPNGNTHFVVVWRCIGQWVQLMDPATGRRWTTRQRFLNELYLHTQRVPASAWREWAGTDEFLTPLRTRLHQLELAPQAINRVVDDALTDPDWRALAALDTTTRLVTAIVRAQGVRQRQAISTLVTQLYQQARIEFTGITASVPTAYWSVQPGTSAPDEEAQLLLKGPVLVRIVQKQQQLDRSEGEEGVRGGIEVEELSPELKAALTEPPVRPGRELLRMLRADGMLAPLSLFMALAMAALGITLEALLFPSLMNIGVELQRFDQCLLLFGAVMFLFVSNLLIEVVAVSAILRFGRRIEARLRMAFLLKIPRLTDRYFQSRLTSDLVYRYPNRPEPVLRNCTFTIQHGQRILLEGVSGGGKSTLSALIIGLRQPDAGLLLLAGFDWSTLGNVGWRQRIVAAPQFHENYVLTETFAFNLLMGRRWPPTASDLAEAEVICRELGLGERKYD